MRELFYISFFLLHPHIHPRTDTYEPIQTINPSFRFPLVRGQYFFFRVVPGDSLSNKEQIISLLFALTRYRFLFFLFATVLLLLEIFFPIYPCTVTFLFLTSQIVRVSLLSRAYLKFMLVLDNIEARKIFSKYLQNFNLEISEPHERLGNALFECRLT